MARFDVYANPDKAEVKHTPYLLDLQNDYLKGIDTRIVVPLHFAKQFQFQANLLHQVFNINGDLILMDITSLASIPASALKKSITNLSSEQHKIQEALDAVFGGY